MSEKETCRGKTDFKGVETITGKKRAFNTVESSANNIKRKEINEIIQGEAEMDELHELKLRFKLQMKKQIYDNSGRKHEFIEIADELFKIVEELQEKIKRIESIK